MTDRSLYRWQQIDREDFERHALAGKQGRDIPNEFYELRRGRNALVATLRISPTSGPVGEMMTREPYSGPPKWVWCFSVDEEEGVRGSLLLRGHGDFIWLIPASLDDIAGIVPPDLSRNGEGLRFPPIPDPQIPKMEKTLYETILSVVEDDNAPPWDHP